MKAERDKIAARINRMIDRALAGVHGDGLEWVRAHAEGVMDAFYGCIPGRFSDQRWAPEAIRELLLAYVRIAPIEVARRAAKEADRRYEQCECWDSSEWFRFHGYVPLTERAS